MMMSCLGLILFVTSEYFKHIFEIINARLCTANITLNTRRFINASMSSLSSYTHPLIVYDMEYENGDT